MKKFINPDYDPIKDNLIQMYIYEKDPIDNFWNALARLIHKFCNWNIFPEELFSSKWPLLWTLLCIFIGFLFYSVLPGSDFYIAWGPIAIIWFFAWAIGANPPS